MENGRRSPVDWDAIKKRAETEGKVRVIPPVDPDKVRSKAEQPVEGTIGNKSKQGGGRAIGIDTAYPVLKGHGKRQRR
jgi:hypothetical protein